MCVIRTLIRGIIVALCWTALACHVLHAAETPIPEAPSQWVTDTAGFMSPGAAQALNTRLEAYERATGHQLLVYIGQTTGDAPIEDWAVRAFAKWRVGRKGIDDGLALFIMAADRKLRIEVGYGLEPVIPDAIAARVINDVIIPRVQAGDRDGAVDAGMDAIMTVIGGGALQPQRPGENERRPLTLLQLLGYALVGIVILFILVTNPTLALYLLASLISGGNRRHGGWGRGGGGGWGGGGGFSGGGGRSGGGGATGSW